MEIWVNGQRREIEAGSTIADVLELLGLEPRQVAVERNLELAPRSGHAKTTLADGDRLEVVTLVGGG